ncbi:MAG: purine-nucleoside phosphorylase [Acidobacteria bacterium]|nr:purine-nucleoside phosphorylase [Acidobacteriota bacterium]
MARLFPATESRVSGEYERAEEAAAFIRNRTRLQPRIGLVLGSGLGAFADELADATAIPYAEIPHFPRSTAVGHAGRFVVGRSGYVPVAAMQGRAHYYEGYSIREVVFPVRVFHQLGVRVLVLTNAAGGINLKLKQCGLLVIRDHISLQGVNPLLGPNDERWGPRFPDMTEAYSKRLAAIAHEEAKKLELELFEGVYAALAGPSYETPAEIRYLRTIGADVVGMSTVPEVIVANHMGMRVLALSCVTNMAAGILDKKLSHAEVLEAGERVREQFTALLQALLPRLAREAE